MPVERFLDTNIIFYGYDLDAMILAAPHAGSAKELLTEDLDHGQNYDGIQVINPFRER